MEHADAPALEAISPYVRLAHDYVTEYDKRFDLNHCVDHALHYFKSGEGFYTIEGIRHPILAGTVFIVRPGVPFSFEAKPGTHFHMLNLHFDLVPQADSREIDWPYQQGAAGTRVPEPIRLPGRASHQTVGFPDRVRISDFSAYEQLFYRILQGFRERDTTGLLRTKGALLELLHLIWLHTELAPASRYDPSLEDSLEAAIRHIAAHLQERISLADLAEAACMSASYFSKCFKRRYGASPMKYVGRMRIEHAKLELSLSNKPIKRIAAESGFDGLHPFYHAFRRDAGMSPGEYRAAFSGSRMETADG